MQISSKRYFFLSIQRKFNGENHSSVENESWRSYFLGIDIRQYDDGQCGILNYGDELLQNVVFVPENEDKGESFAGLEGHFINHMYTILES